MNMINQPVSLLVAATFTWMSAMLFGALAFDTFVLYPNIFSDVPSSLELSMKFLRAGSPRTFFAPAGTLLLLIGISNLVVVRKHRRCFKFYLTAFLLIVCGEFLLSVFFFWPLNTIMFLEGKAMHSESELIQVAKRFQNLHWLRLLVSFLASGIAMTGFVFLTQEKIPSVVE